MFSLFSLDCVQSVFSLATKWNILIKYLNIMCFLVGSWNLKVSSSYSEKSSLILSNFFIFLAATKWPAQGTVMFCLLFLSVSSNSKYIYLHISLSIQLGSLWNFKPKLLCHKPMIPTCLFAIWGDYHIS